MAQPHGPYLLVGCSVFGCTSAHAVACELERRGRASMLVLLDGGAATTLLAAAALPSFFSVNNGGSDSTSTDEDDDGLVHVDALSSRDPVLYSLWHLVCDVGTVAAGTRSSRALLRQIEQFGSSARSIGAASSSATVRQLPTAAAITGSTGSRSSSASSNDTGFDVFAAHVRSAGDTLAEQLQFVTSRFKPSDVTDAAWEAALIGAVHRGNACRQLLLAAPQSAHGATAAGGSSGGSSRTSAAASASAARRANSHHGGAVASSGQFGGPVASLLTEDASGAGFLADIRDACDGPISFLPLECR